MRIVKPNASMHVKFGNWICSLLVVTMFIVSGKYVAWAMGTLELGTAP